MTKQKPSCPIPHADLFAEVEPFARQSAVHGGGQTAWPVISCAGAGQAPGDHGLVSGVEQLDLADDRAIAAKMPPF